MRYIEVAGEAIDYRVFGSGEPLVLLHGFGGSHLDWESVAQILADQGFEVIIPNLARFYVKRHSMASFSQQAHLLRTFLDLLTDEKGKVSLAGVSYGGALGWAISLLAPEMIHKLVLVNPMPPHPKRRFKDAVLKVFLKFAKKPQSLVIFLRSRPAKMMFPHLERMFRFPYLESKKGKRKVAHMTDRKAKVIANLASSFYQIISKENWEFWESRLVNIETPVLLLWGDNDKLFDRSVYLHMDRQLPFCKLKQIENGSHMMIKDEFDEISKEMKSFLRPLSVLRKNG